MRTLAVDNTFILLRDEDAERLASQGVIYPCSDPEHDHDFHVNPEDASPFGVEDLLLAVVKAQNTPSLEDLDIKTLTLDGIITPAIALSTEPDKLQKKIAFMQRNLALNVATQALKSGLFEATADVRNDAVEGIKVAVSATIIPPKARANFVYLAKMHVIRLIQALPGLDDQRKTEVIALIRNA